jgi:transcriptional regulator
MPLTPNSRELKKGSAELLILSLLEECPRHGYDIARHIELRSKGALSFHAASLYPLLYRLERRGLIKGRWLEKASERRRRMYRITPEGRDMLAVQRDGWQAFVAAVNSVAAGGHA